MTNTKKEISTPTTLLELCRKKDPNAWDRLTKMYKKLVFYWLKENNIPSDACDGVYQDILQTLSDQFRSFRKGPTGKFRNWLRKIVYSHIVDFYDKGEGKKELKGGSRAGKKTNLEAVDNKLDADNITAEQELQEQTILNRQILVWLRDRRYNPVHIEAFELVAFKGMKSRVAAEKINLSADNVRQINFRVRKLLRDIWDGLL